MATLRLVGGEGRGLVDQSLVGDGRRRGAPAGNDVVSVSLSLSVSVTVLSLTVVYVVNVCISHIFSIFHIQHGCMCGLKDHASLVLSLFLEKLYPI